VFRGYEAGAVDFLYKPIGAHTLKSKIDVFVDLYRKTTELTAANATLQRTTALLSRRSRTSRTSARRCRTISGRRCDRSGRSPRSSPNRCPASSTPNRPTRSTACCAALRDDPHDRRAVRAAQGQRERQRRTTDVDVGAVLADVLENLRSEIERSGARISHGDCRRRSDPGVCRI